MNEHNLTIKLLINHAWATSSPPSQPSPGGGSSPDGAEAQTLAE